MAENTPFTLTIDGQSVTFKPIEAAHLRLDLAAAMNENTNRAFAAVLGLAWVGEGKPKASLERCRYNVLTYGGLVINELVKRGLTAVQVVTYGAAVFSQCVSMKGIITESEVKEAAGFSEGGEASSG
jgi:hypothetical protein